MADGGYFQFMQIRSILNLYRKYKDNFHKYFELDKKKWFVPAILKNRHCAESTQITLGDFFVYLSPVYLAPVVKK